MELIAHAGIYLAEGITNLDASFAAKETAAEMVLILLEIVGGVILDVGSVALVSIHTDMTKQELGAALGMGNVAVVGITDAGFAAATESKQGERTYGKI